MNSINIEKTKDHFPIFKNRPDLVYLDNAATTQKPQVVIDSLVNFYSNHNSNVHRGLYPLSEEATTMYEDARKTIAKFINADPEEIIFTSGSTDGLNILANTLKISGMISEKPKILLTDLEHHSNILPWQRLNPEKIYYLSLSENNTIEYYDDSSGRFTDPSIEEVDIVSFTHASNVTGEILPVKLIANERASSYTILDASQSIGHMEVDVKDLDIDFMVFSGHKMYGPTGIGVIYGKRDLLEQMQPFKVGGGMIKEVQRDKATWAALPEKFEAGTPSIADAIALAEAVRFIQNIGFDNIQKHEEELRKYLYQRLQEIENIKIYHPRLDTKALGNISFYLNEAHPHDLAQFLGDKNICVRAGHHCTQILHREVLEIPASLRASLGVYNTKDDIDKMIDALKDGIKMYQT